MTINEAHTQGLDMFFLPTAVEAEAFALHLAKHTGRATGFFTEGVRWQFQLHVVTVEPRPRPSDPEIVLPEGWDG